MRSAQGALRLHIPLRHGTYDDARNGSHLLRLKRITGGGNGHEDPDSYDLITIIKLNLSSGESVEHRGILWLLTVLLSHRMTPAEKKKVLSEDFDIPMTREIDTEVDSMCNLSEGIWVEAKNEGREEGDYNHARNSALRMAKDNLPLDMIAKYVSYSTDVVRSWIAAAAAE